MKGDAVSVLVGAGGSVDRIVITASKAGRGVAVKWTTKYLDVSETTRPTRANPKGRPVGNRVRARVEAVLSVTEQRQEP